MSFLLQIALDVNMNLKWKIFKKDIFFDMAFVRKMKMNWNQLLIFFFSLFSFWFTNFWSKRVAEMSKILQGNSRKTPFSSIMFSYKVHIQLKLASSLHSAVPVKATLVVAFFVGITRKQGENHGKMLSIYAWHMRCTTSSYFQNFSCLYHFWL